MAHAGTPGPAAGWQAGVPTASAETPGTAGLGPLPFSHDALCPLRRWRGRARVSSLPNMLTMARAELSQSWEPGPHPCLPGEQQGPVHPREGAEEPEVGCELGPSNGELRGGPNCLTRLSFVIQHRVRGRPLLRDKHSLPGTVLLCPAVRWGRRVVPQPAPEWGISKPGGNPT